MGTSSPALVHAEEFGSEVAATATSETAAKRPMLSASDLIKQDTAPNVLLLKDILFTIKLYPTFLEKQDPSPYAAIRNQLRTSPGVELRKTAKNLKKYLTSPQQVAEFEQKYDALIDKVNELDVICLKRLQGENVPQVSKRDGSVAKDVEMEQLISSTVLDFEQLLKVIGE